MILIRTNHSCLRIGHRWCCKTNSDCWLYTQTWRASRCNLSTVLHSPRNSPPHSGWMPVCCCSLAWASEMAWLQSSVAPQQFIPHLQDMVAQHAELACTGRERKSTKNIYCVEPMKTTMPQSVWQQGPKQCPTASNHSQDIEHWNSVVRRQALGMRDQGQHWERTRSSNVGLLLSVFFFSVSWM
jgi:hypothetical protein